MLVAVLALAAGAAATASATPKLDLTWSGEERQEATNEPMNVFVGNAGNEGGTVTIDGKPGWGTVTCEAPWATSGWFGTDKTNNKPTDQVEVGSPYGVLAGGECSNNSGLGEHANVTFNAKSASLSLNGGTGIAKVVARYSTEPITLSMAYSGGDVCNYHATALTGAVALVPWGPWFQVSTSFTKAPLTLTKATSAHECSPKAYVSVTFGFSANPEEGNYYYVFGHLT
jgi:hypothetical protein